MAKAGHVWGSFGNKSRIHRTEPKSPADGYRGPAARALVRKQLHRRKRNSAYTASDCSGCTRKPQSTTSVLRAINIKAAIA